MTLTQWNMTSLRQCTLTQVSVVPLILWHITPSWHVHCPQKQWYQWWHWHTGTVTPSWHWHTDTVTHDTVMTFGCSCSAVDIVVLNAGFWAHQLPKVIWHPWRAAVTFWFLQNCASKLKQFPNKTSWTPLRSIEKQWIQNGRLHKNDKMKYVGNIPCTQYWYGRGLTKRQGFHIFGAYKQPRKI